MAKHDVLREYIRKYIGILCLNMRRSSLKLTVLDGFCGGGLYSDGNGGTSPGSPVVLADGIEAGIGDVIERRQQYEMREPFRASVTLWCNDMDARALRQLAEVFRQRPESPLSPSVRYTQLLFDRAVDQLLVEARSMSRPPRTIIVADQYGYSDASFNTMRSIFSVISCAEMILTYSIDHLLNFASPANREVIRKSLAKHGLDGELTPEYLEELKETDGARHAIQTLFMEDIFPKTGAAFATPFFIVPRRSRRGYWLVHLANNRRANDEMKQLHWEIKNHFMHFGKEGVGILVFDPAHLEGMQSGFDFGDEARRRSMEALKGELPKLLRDEVGERVEAGDLEMRLANNTPATTAMVREALMVLSASRELEVRSAVGRERRKAAGIEPTDVIQIPAQRQIYLPPPKVLK